MDSNQISFMPTMEPLNIVGTSLTVLQEAFKQGYDTGFNTWAVKPIIRWQDKSFIYHCTTWEYCGDSIDVDDVAGLIDLQDACRTLGRQCGESWAELVHTMQQAKLSWKILDVSRHAKHVPEYSIKWAMNDGVTVGLRRREDKIRIEWTIAIKTESKTGVA
jgi:hypothetical protein